MLSKEQRSTRGSAKHVTFLLKIIAILVVGYFVASAQTPRFLYVNQFGGPGVDLGIGIAADQEDNIFVTGSFQNTADFDGIKLIAAGSEDIFLAKYDSAGEIQWVKQAGGTVNGGITFERGDGIATDSEGNIYISGTFQGTASFDETTLASAGNFDVFTAKYDTNGLLQWVTRAGGIANDVGFGLALDSADNVLITGAFEGTTNFNETTLRSAGNLDAFIAKYDANGEFLWARQISGEGRNNAFDLATDSADNVLVTGRFEQTARFAETTLTSAGSSDIFFAKYTPSGELLWVQQDGGVIGETGRAIDVDNEDNIFVTGQLGQLGYSLAKYDAEGSLQWIKRAEGIQGGNLTANYATLDGEGNAILTGTFRIAANVEGNTLTGTAGGRDLFIAKYDSDGVFEWVIQAGSTEPDGGESITIDSQGNVYVTGFIRGAATFGEGIITPHEGGDDVFVAKLGLD